MKSIISHEQTMRDVIYSHNKETELGYPQIPPIQTEEGYYLSDEKGELPYKKTLYKSSKWCELMQLLIARRAKHKAKHGKYKDDNFHPFLPDKPHERSIIRMSQDEYDHFIMPIELHDREGKRISFKKALRANNKTASKLDFQFYEKCIRDAKKAMDYGLAKERCILLGDWAKEQIDPRLKITDHIIIERMRPHRDGGSIFTYRLHLPNWMYLPAIDPELAEAQPWFKDYYGGRKLSIMRVPCYQSFAFEVAKRYVCLSFEKFMKVPITTQTKILEMSERLSLGLDDSNPSSFRVFEGALDTSIPLVMSAYAIYFNSHKGSYASIHRDFSDLQNHVVPTLFMKDTHKGESRTRFKTSAEIEGNRLKVFWDNFIGMTSFDGVYPRDIQFPKTQGTRTDKGEVLDTGVKIAYGGQWQKYNPKTKKTENMPLLAENKIIDVEGNVDFELCDIDKKPSLDEMNPNS